MTIWFTSDTHYGHKNIVRGVSNWSNKSGCRDFDTIEQMNDAMVENINACVKADDTLYHLGDVAMGLFENVAKFLQRLHCQNIHLILGNHDHHIRKDRDGVQSYFASTQKLYFKRIGEIEIMMCHFPMLVWENHHRGAWHLHGHSHGHLDDPVFYQRKVIDVGMDAHPEFRPYSFDEIAAIMETRSIQQIDHH